MKPSPKAQYRMRDLSFHNMVMTMIKASWFSQVDLNSLQDVNADYRSMVPEVLCLLTIIFFPLCLPFINYEKQTGLDPHRVDMASTAMVHFNSDPDKVI